VALVIKVRRKPRSVRLGQSSQSAIVFWQKGYDDASITDLVKAMGITPPSLYAAFGNKESLFLRTLQHYAEGPSSYALKALDALAARQVAEQRLYATIEARFCGAAREELRSVADIALQQWPAW
jgi:AcrR family transcriptional regulator